MARLWFGGDGSWELNPTESERKYFYPFNGEPGGFAGDCRLYLRRLIIELEKAGQSDRPLTPSIATPIQDMASQTIDAFDQGDIQRVGWMMVLIGDQVRMLRDYEAGDIELEALGRQYRDNTTRGGKSTSVLKTDEDHRLFEMEHGKLGRQWKKLAEVMTQHGRPMSPKTASRYADKLAKVDNASDGQK